jgi:hypothetical protein
VSLGLYSGRRRQGLEGNWVVSQRKGNTTRDKEEVLRKRMKMEKKMMMMM